APVRTGPARVLPILQYSITPILRLLERFPAPRAEAGIGQVRDGLLPACVRVMVVEPDAVDGVLDQGGAEGGHAVPAVAAVGWADALPAVGRRADFPIRADGRGLG